MSHVRHAAVAGMFYPGNPRELAAEVRRHLADAESRPHQGPPPKAIIAPHAGYVYSGPVAAFAYVRLQPLRGRVRRVLLLGPCHRVVVRGLAVTTAEAFATPLGQVAVDRAAVEALLALPQVCEMEAAHTDEHSLEVHLPFLQEVLGEFRLVPLVVGQATAEEVAEVLERLWGGEETLIVISSDLSHYLDYETARRVDQATCTAIEALNPAAIGYDQACGRVPVAGLLTVARRRRLSVETLDLRNSGDTAGDRRRVVGYGAWVFTEAASRRPRPGEGGDGVPEDFRAATRRMLDRHGATLLHLAAASIEHGLVRHQSLSVSVGDYAEDLRISAASFVTLQRNGVLRGCVGSAEAYRPLVADVAANAFAAAFGDRWFGKLTADERRDLSLSVSVLSQPEAMQIEDEDDLLRRLRPGADGLILASGKRRALFLPQVWEALPAPKKFVGQLKAKAGLAADDWPAEMRAWRFAAVSVSSSTLADPAALWT